IDDELEFYRLLHGTAGLAPFRILSTYVAARRNKSVIIGPYDIRPPACTNSGEEYIAGSLFLVANSTIRFKCAMRRASGKLIRACARSFNAASNTLSKSLALRTPRDWSFNPSLCAAA